MKITRVEGIPLSVPLVSTEPRQIWADAWSRQVLVKVCADSGVCGVGEIFMNTSSYGPYLSLIEELGRHVSGLPADPNAVVDVLERRTYSIGRGGIVASVVGGIEVAVYDLAAKSLGVPLHRLLGGKRRDWVKAYASLARYKTCGDAEKVVEYALGRGFKAVKLHQHGDEVVECVARIRGDLGYGFELMVDLNTTLGRRSALGVLRKLERYELAWVEEPIWPPEDYKSLGRLARLVEIPIAAGENEYTLRGFADLVEEGGVSVLQPDAAKVGGLGKMVKIEGLAEALGAIVAPHSRPHSLWANILVAVHFVSTLPYESVVEIPPTPPVQEPLAVAVEFKDGAVKVPDVPGIGVKDDGWFGLYPPKEGEALDYHSR
ncbi:Mandelate racemase/muconate lactonizing protein [Thermoproteus uzoniensis 768-20]|uniref:Mandelate racemase/muconate lactonizing protein n=1 Tax=Thermoproteus uzoniensis (strain 768-20) TaxID=999630 RepID=F2L1G5_THEU7|nr:mandelate racemase/muconate lactonizing enzyme family protein [Thermoproteus uzoniensis]AEA11635.1 Mandelate racemase/muconate lactonizing protein [Thermoproteus uzoniensis 768-20]